ncbi:hypothetical protein G7046_g8868 [Stylonectria norvegica]|nr:hypothetical protein G7046_g8868 [Stylonectria norvegica]
MSQPDGLDAVTTEDLTNMLISGPTSDFADQSQLTYLIPSQTNLDLEIALKNIEGGKSILDSIKRRDSLFFDETVDVLLILRAPWTDEKTLRSHLNRLEVSLEAQIVNGTASNRDGSPAAETIFTGTVQDADDPFIVVDEEDSDAEEDAGQHIYAAWKLPVFLARPRMRLHSPSVVFSASASLKPEVSAELNTRGSGYLPSGVPSGFNLLESFGNDAALDGVKPRLSALRVSRVAPVTRQQDLLKHIRALQHLELKIFPVVHTRIRFSRPNTTPSSSAVIALLEIDFTSHIDCEVSLDKIELSIPDSTIEGLNEEAGMKLPLSCVSHDHITFLYRIAPHELDVNPKNPTRDLEITISATAQVVPGVCTPPLNMSWTANLDFTTPVNPGFGPTTGAGIQRAHRPSQLSITGQAVHPLISPISSLPDLGITMTFSGPSEPVHPGDVFSWTVYIVNRTTEKSARPPRKLALVAVPKRRRNDVRMMRPPSTGGRRRGEKEVADAVLDENVLHAMQKSSMSTRPTIICSECRHARMEAIRVVDLGSQEHVDIRELPTMTVEPVGA